MNTFETEYDSARPLGETRPAFTEDQNAFTQDDIPRRQNYVPSHNPNAPAFEALDIVAAGLASAMMLGPLIATTVGFGG